MRPFKDYDKTQAYSDYERLPKGAYILTVLGVSMGRWQSGDEYIQISCDILEGDYNGFFAKRYKEDKREDKKWGCNYNLAVPKDDDSERDGWAKRRFKTVMNAFEDSNAGYHWDWNENGLKGKHIGGLFNIRQWDKGDGNIGEATNLAQLVSVESVQQGTYKMPKDKLIETTSTDSFVTIPDGFDDSLPFS